MQPSVFESTQHKRLKIPRIQGKSELKELTGCRGPVLRKKGKCEALHDWDRDFLLSS